MIFDSHAHYDDGRFDADRDELLRSMNGQGVGMILNSCSELADVPKILKMCEEYDFMYASIGVHPHCVGEMKKEDLEELERLSQYKKFVAIGEIGLDYYYDNSPRELQRYWFEEQLRLAKNLKLPIVIHDRDAHEDCMEIMRRVGVSDIGGVFHCYAGGVEMAREILSWGMYIAFGGTLTFRNARRPIEVAKSVPLDRILIETDCPYLTPEPHRGERNNSAYLKYVVEKLAEIKEVSCEEIERITFENAKKCFRIEGI